MTNRWPVSPGKVPLLGSPCPPVPMGSTADRRRHRDLGTYSRTARAMSGWKGLTCIINIIVS